MSQRLAAIAALAVAYLALTLAVATGAVNTSDHQVASGLASAWNEQLHGLFQVIAELGGIELTSILVVALVVYLLRNGFGPDAWALIAFPAAIAVETLYKLLLPHPDVPASLRHTDGPSVSEFFAGAAGVHNSFPSGHVVRAVVVYGLIAFVIGRLARSGRVRVIASVGAVVIVALVGFDRLYLEAHWESDVIGGVLLGGIALLGATVWLDRPVKEG